VRQRASGAGWSGPDRAVLFCGDDLFCDGHIGSPATTSAVNAIGGFFFLPKMDSISINFARGLALLVKTMRAESTARFSPFN
jgi:hypothetical protein